jgi:uncharacterized protein YutE (UPF0331/DUF86 family)
LVDAEQVEHRLGWLEAMLEQLDEVRGAGEEAYLADPRQRLATESSVAERLGNAARQRNLLVHLYTEIDDRAVFASLAFLDDLREFAAAVGRLAESEDDSL